MKEQSIEVVKRNSLNLSDESILINSLAFEEGEELANCPYIKEINKFINPHRNEDLYNLDNLPADLKYCLN